MQCNAFKDINFNQNFYCKKCGMDLGFNPITKKSKGQLKYYCCQDCAVN